MNNFFLERPFYNRSEIEAQLELCDWTFAKTMPKIPHFWTVKRKYEGVIPFIELVRGIETYGVLQRWRKTPPRKYLHVGDYRYWLMDEKVEDVTLINRAHRKDDKDGDLVDV